MYLPPLLRRKKAGYGVPSCTKDTPLVGVPGMDEGMSRLLVLTDGVFMAGVLSDEFVPELALSLLRERLDDDGEGGTGTDAMVPALGSVLVRTPVSFAFRLRARSFCSLTRVVVLSGELGRNGDGGCV